MTPYAYRHMQTGPGTIEMAINRHRMAHAAHQQPSLVRAVRPSGFVPAAGAAPLYFLCRVYDSDVLGTERSTQITIKHDVITRTSEIRACRVQSSKAVRLTKLHGRREPETVCETDRDADGFGTDRTVNDAYDFHSG